MLLYKKLLLMTFSTTLVIMAVLHFTGDTLHNLYNGMFRIFEAKTDEIQGEWTNLQHTDLHNLHTSLNFMKIMKSQRKR
jgi:hypothetical protein